MDRKDIYPLVLILLMALIIGAGLYSMREPSKACDCGAICNAKQNCGLSECPTARAK